MVILHIAAIKNNPYSGVSVAVPEHVLWQNRYAVTALLNINNITIDTVNCQIDFKEPFDITTLSAPFSKPDVVVFHEIYQIKYLSIYKDLIKNGIPYILIPHGELTAEAQRKKWIKKKTANILLFNRFINHSIAIQCLSERESNSIRREKDKFIATNGLKIPGKRKTVFNQEKVKFVYIGRLEAYDKGLDLMLESFRLNRDFLIKNKCTLDIYGPNIEGRLRHLEALVYEKKIGDIVNIYREVSGKEKEEVLMSADIFIQTSRSEGMPLGILEALSYGLPCLVTEGTTLGKEIEEANAGWNSETDAEMIAKTIINAVEDRKYWNVKSQNGCRLIKEMHDWDKIACDTIKQYEQFVK